MAKKRLQNDLSQQESDVSEQRSGRLPRMLRWINRHRAGVLVLAVGFSMLVLVVFISYSRAESVRDWVTQMNVFSTSSGSRGGGNGLQGINYRSDGTVELGEYSVSVFDGASGSTLRTDFRLEGRTVCENKKAFDDFMRGNHRFFREQVNVTLRNCEPSELADPDLPLLERKLVSRINRSLGRPFLTSVEIQGYALLESVEREEFIERTPPADR